MTQKGKSRNVLASPLGEEGHEVAKGCTRVRMIMILDVDVTAERRHYNTHRPLKGKRLTTFCASLALLHPLLSLTHWIFRSLMLPYKSSSLVQNVFAVHRKGDTTTLGAKGPVKLKNPRARKGQSILRTVPFTTLLHNPPPAGGHNPRGAAPSTLTPKVCPMPLSVKFYSVGEFFQKQ